MHRPGRPRSPIAARRAGSVLLLAWLLLAAQALALVHGVAHGGAGSTLVGAEADFAGAAAARADAHAPHALFDSHDEGSPECRLIDGAAQALAGPPAAIDVACLLPATEPVRIGVAGRFGAPGYAPQQARAPPRG